LGKNLISGSTQDFENLTMWSGLHTISTEDESVMEIISIKARDKNNHYKNIGGGLDINPSTPARRKTVVAGADDGLTPIQYKWVNYDKNHAGTNNHVDTNHRIKIDRGELKSIAVIAAPHQINPCSMVTFEAREGIYKFEDGETQTMPLSQKDIERIIWNWEGTYNVLHKKKLIREGQQKKELLGTASVVRAEWPDSEIKGIARIGNIIGEDVADVKPIGEGSSFFKIEDVSTDVKLKVGESYQNRAVKFFCAGIDKFDYKPTTEVYWESDSPEILECSSSGQCTGRSVGIANVRLFYRENGRKGTFITSRPVEVYKEQIDCKPIRDA
jgi:hypothetical protein